MNSALLDERVRIIGLRIWQSIDIKKIQEKSSSFESSILASIIP